MFYCICPLLLFVVVSFFLLHVFKLRLYIDILWFGGCFSGYRLTLQPTKSVVGLQLNGSLFLSWLLSICLPNELPKV